MILRFVKGREGRPDILTCVREDGSCTWQRSSSFFVRHDLIHYAVETTLGYTEAFLGLVARGRDLDDFGTKSGVKDSYTVEEGWAESIVGAVQWPSLDGDPAIRDADWAEMLAETCRRQEFPVPPVTEGQIARIRVRVDSLHAQWDALPEGAVMDLVFRPGATA